MLEIREITMIWGIGFGDGVACVLWCSVSMGCGGGGGIVVIIVLLLFCNFFACEGFVDFHSFPFR
jgi:hypothetical protein